MFEKETVFILGAGASVPYDYPIGKKLIKDIINNMEDKILLPYVFIPGPGRQGKYNYNGNDSFFDFTDFKKPIEELIKNGAINSFTASERQIQILSSEILYSTNFKDRVFCTQIKSIKEFDELREALIEFDPVSIDTFLRDNPSHASCGKMMIIYSLLKNENKKKFELYRKTSINDMDEKDADNWYSYLMNDILSGCSDDPKKIEKSKLHIITFNYDLSLDYYLYSRLGRIERIKKESEAFWNILKEERIKHVYGQLYSYDEIQFYGDFVGKTEDQNTKRFLQAYANQGEIYLMNGERDHNDRQKELEVIKKIVSDAKEIIIIGFSFDRDNLNMLGFPAEYLKWREFLGIPVSKKIKYMDFEGRMGGLAFQFNNIGKKTSSQIYPSINRSNAERIIDAYQNDFKVSLY